MRAARAALVAAFVVVPARAYAFDLIGQSALSALEQYYNSWIDMVHRTHEQEQPDWMTPVVTIIPDLQQEIRTDFGFADAPHGLETYSYLLKGTEIIPTENQELIFGNPAWVTRNLPLTRDSSGFADWTFLYKYRILSAPNDAGNYVLTFLFGTSYETGSDKYISGNHDYFTPMIGFGKGWGAFDYQATIGPSVPDGEAGKLGTPVTWNSTFQYHLRIPTPFLDERNQASSLWPEVETTWISFPNGENRGVQQLYLTFGAIAGRFRLSERAWFVLGLGYQEAVTKARLYNHQWLVTMRIPFF